MTDCLFCKIIDGDVPGDKIFEDDLVLVFKDIYPKAEVHWLMIPKIHIGSLADITEEHDALMAHMMRLLPELAKKAGLDSGFRTVINTGEGGGQIIFHLHIHLLGGKTVSSF